MSQNKGTQGRPQRTLRAIVGEASASLADADIFPASQAPPPVAGLVRPTLSPLALTAGPHWLGDWPAA